MSSESESVQVHGKVTMVRPVCKITRYECTTECDILHSAVYCACCNCICICSHTASTASRCALECLGACCACCPTSGPPPPPLPLTSSEFLWTVCKQFPVKLDFLSAWTGIPQHSLFTGMLIVARQRQNKGNRGQEDEARPCFQW